MNNKSKTPSVICVGVVELALLVAFSVPHIGEKPATAHRSPCVRLNPRG